jgi:NitT/TauT family transport system substrate-binding protein
MTELRPGEPLADLEISMRRSIVLMVMFALGLTGCALGTDGGSPQDGVVQKVTVGVIPIVDVAPIYLGKQKGFFSSHGIEVNLVSAQGGAAIVSAVVSGEYQFGFSNVISLMIAADKGLPVRMTCAGDASTGRTGADFGAVVVDARSPIRTAADLEGKTVSVNTLKNIGDTTVRASVRKAGGDPSRIKFVELPFPDMPAALADGRVDAAWLVEPFLTAATGHGARIVAWNFVDTAPNLPVAAYFTTATYTNKNAVLVRRFTAAMIQSSVYAQTHPDEARAIIPTYTKITTDQANALTLPQWPTIIDVNALAVLADLATQDGLVTAKPDLSALLP